jgi:amino acid adenylation domain-containing protein
VKGRKRRTMQNTPITTVGPILSAGLIGQVDESSNPDAAATCMHEMFESQVERTPDAVAVVFGHEQLTYRQLNNHANQLARELVRLGVAAESLVGICVDRSPQMVVGLLAIMKAGGAYVPLDPAYPHERLAFMLKDANASVLLTQSGLIERLPPYDGQRLCLDSDWHFIKQNSTENLGTSVSQENLAYVIYTSGSTGKPKGAMIRHRGLTNYLNWCTEAYEIADGCGAPVHSSISFDLTITSLFAPLMVGRSVFLVGDGIQALAQALLERENYSLVKITPAHLRALAELLPPEQVAGRVRALIIGGEALHLESLSFWREHAPATRLINEYGPTETVVGCCVYEVAGNDPAGGAVPIGRPISNTALYILDDELQTVSPGQTGELFIGGDGVGRGYLGREELTRERFIPNPYDKRSTLYRSGDLARMLPNANLEYLGRVDDQVKVRGFRVELGEIETVLKRHSSVSDCAVVMCDEASGEKRLVAFFVSNETETCDDENLRRFLNTKLPDYMIPSAFVALEMLPLTINGKVDRQALACLVPESLARPDFVAARTPVEATLANIWADVLNVKAVGVTDNFFDLGGDSILGTLILARAARAGLKLSPVLLFEYQTIAELATVIGGALQNTGI